MCVLIFIQLLSEIFFFIRRTRRDIIVNVRGSSFKVLLYFRQILMKLEFCQQIFEKSRISYSIEFHTVRKAGIA
jgi:hypothetical protein